MILEVNTQKHYIFKNYSEFQTDLGYEFEYECHYCTNCQLRGFEELILYLRLLLQCITSN